MHPSLETSRLVLRQWRSDDLAGLATINADPDVMRYIHDGRPLDRAATAERLASYQRHWNENGFGLVVAHARSELPAPRLVSIHVVGNEASTRVMVKLGMSLERETVQPDSGRRVRVYAMDL